MKRVLAFIMSVILIFSMSACGKSKAQKELEKIQEEQRQLEEAGEAAQRAADELEDTWEQYNKYKSMLDNYS